MNGTATVPLDELDEVRTWADKYKEVNQGIEGFVAHLKKEDALAEADTSKKKKKKALLPYKTFIEAIKAYNATDPPPKHPFTL